MTPEEAREYHRQYKRRWRKLYPEKHRAENKKYYSREYKRRWDAANKDRVAAHQAKSRRNHRGRRAAELAAYRAKKLQATPAWANDFFIKEIYRLAELRTKLLGVKHDVDHIVPLQSLLVCGLHCEANLRVITASENRRKHNKVWPDMPNGEGCISRT